MIRLLWVFWITSTGVCFCLGLAVALCLWLPFDTSQHLLSEDGPIEQASMGLWFVAAVVVLVRNRDTKSPDMPLYAALFGLFGLREADLHKSVTGHNMLKLKFYTTGDWSLEKIILGVLALMILVIVVAAMIRLVQFIALRGGWKTASGQLALSALGLLAVARIADRLPSILRDDFGFELEERVKTALLAVEETGEMLVPLMFILAFLSRFTPLSRRDALRGTADGHTDPVTSITLQTNSFVAGAQRSD